MPERLSDIPCGGALAPCHLKYTKFRKKRLQSFLHTWNLNRKKDKSCLKDKKPRDMITFMLYENAPFNINNIPLFLEGEGKRLKFETEGKPRFTYWLYDGETLFERIKELLEKMKVLLKERE